ncbi:conserved hypothetical protein [Theileria equi strain WA]|uniref:Uncharacterized protein n=1 Tax=Theileria equi strain WA TaxID=1537102 RepID=L1LFQ4_THEEQ|nr:conserved hypothetical protein [Theileria equi strain WA]EKX74186.1 conserved hypothetical protein [Theileria equi strain WA]|eukprot:XP_004833638.1 conserved hypothetical protein [Theileria equi strain WA]
MEIVSNPVERIKHCLGDVYSGYFIPTVICGRSLCFKKDLNKFIKDFCDIIYKEDLSLLEDENKDFGLKSLGSLFKERMISKLLTVSPEENICDVWNLLWGVWADIFNSEPEGKSESYIILHKTTCVYLMFYLYHCQSGLNNFVISLSLETFEACIDLAKIVLERFQVTSVVDVLNYLVSKKCINVALYDGIQYLYQNKYGKPLTIKKKSISRS